MKKKYICLLLAGMLCVSLTACARTPSQALVAQKNNERLEETAKATPQEGTELKDVAEATTSTYDLDYKSDDGKVTIKAEQAPYRGSVPLNRNKNTSYVPHKLLMM